MSILIAMFREKNYENFNFKAEVKIYLNYHKFTKKLNKKPLKVSLENLFNFFPFKFLKKF